MYCISSLIKAGWLYFILQHTVCALKRFKSFWRIRTWRPFRNWEESCGDRLGVGTVYEHVVTVMHRKFNAGSRCDKGQENDPVPLLAVWTGMVGVRFDAVCWVGGTGLKQHFQLAITILLWSVVMEYQQRCYFLVDSHNRTESHMKLWTSLFVFYVYCSCVYPRNHGFCQKIYMVTRPSGRVCSGW